MTVPIPSVGYHVGMVVEDPDASADRYRRLLGASVRTFEYTKPASVLPRAWPETHLRVAYCRVGGLTLELIHPVGHLGMFGAYLDEHGEGVQHLGFWVRDVPGAVEAALRRGATLTAATITPQGDTVVSVADLAIDDLVPMVGPRTAFVDVGTGPEIEFVGTTGVDALRSLLGDQFDELVVVPPWADEPASES